MCRVTGPTPYSKHRRALSWCASRGVRWTLFKDMSLLNVRFMRTSADAHECI